MTRWFGTRGGASSHAGQVYLSVHGMLTLPGRFLWRITDRPSCVPNATRLAGGIEHSRDDAEAHAIQALCTLRKA